MHSDPCGNAGGGAAVVSKPATVEQCHLVIDALAAELAVLRGQVVVLQERLALDSRNSSKPPSSDGPGRGNRAQRRASARKRGGQKGHPGAFRALVPEAQVDRVQECVPPAVCSCGAAVSVRGKPERHQVFDIPPVQPVVSEYRLYSGVCAGCGAVLPATLPAGVPRGQIGPRALATIGTLGTKYQMPQLKIRDLLAQLTGLSFSVGAISQAHGKVAAALAAPVAEATRSLTQASVVHMDETRYGREGSSGNWVWAAIQKQLAIYAVLPSRARYVIHDLIGEKPAAVVVSDRYAGYAFVDAQQRQVCWAHLLRDFRRIAERAGEPGRIGRRLLGLGYVMFRWRERGKTSAVQFAPLQQRARCVRTRHGANWLPPHGRHLHQPPLAVAGVAGLSRPPRSAADQQHSRAGAARHRGQAQDQRVHARQAPRPVRGARLRRPLELHAPGPRSVAFHASSPSTTRCCRQCCLPRLWPHPVADRLTAQSPSRRWFGVPSTCSPATLGVSPDCRKILHWRRIRGILEPIQCHKSLIQFGISQLA